LKLSTNLISQNYQETKISLLSSGFWYLIGGLTYSQLQNSRTAQNYQTKLGILIKREKREDLGWNFLAGGVHKWR
jgi:hypothetical protein